MSEKLMGRVKGKEGEGKGTGREGMVREGGGGREAWEWWRGK
jgi:hypothetical protein